MLVDSSSMLQPGAGLPTKRKRRLRQKLTRLGWLEVHVCGQEMGPERGQG